MNCGVLIAGLAMSASELRMPIGFVGLENPEVRGTESIGETYQIEEIAKFHIERLKRLELDPNKPLYLVGMSMGGMILSVMASIYRDSLPKNTKFLFLVTSPNLPSNPAIPQSLLEQWLEARPNEPATFEPILRPMFSTQFNREQNDRVIEYIRYRSYGENGLNSSGLFKQIKAIQSFDGQRYFSQIDQQNSTFIGGGDDKILGPSHTTNLKALAPEARFIDLSNVGHMINIERPDMVEKWINNEL